MLPISHIGMTVTVVRMLESRNESRWADYRLLAAAAILPDIIDKPLAHILFDRSLYEGRAFGHSLAFVLLVAGLCLFYRLWRKDFFMVTIFFGIAMHDILDVMWFNPQVLFWPVYGWVFVNQNHEAWQGFIHLGGIKISQLDFLDTIGALLLLYFFTRLGSSGKIKNFIKTGKMLY